MENPKKAFIVSVDYQTIAGNPATRCLTIVAADEAEALQSAIDRVRNYKTCLKLEGWNIAESIPKSPAPIDWAKETERLRDLREQAIAYIGSAMPAHGYIELGAGIAYRNGDYECTWDNAILVKRGEDISIGCTSDDEDEPFGDTDLDSIETSVILDICEQLQKASDRPTPPLG
jgi:hypothetical protein